MYDKEKMITFWVTLAVQGRSLDGLPRVIPRFSILSAVISVTHDPTN